MGLNEYEYGTLLRYANDLEGEVKRTINSTVTLILIFSIAFMGVAITGIAGSITVGIVLIVIILLVSFCIISVAKRLVAKNSQFAHRAKSIYAGNYQVYREIILNKRILNTPLANGGELADKYQCHVDTANFSNVYVLDKCSLVRDSFDSVQVGNLGCIIYFPDTRIAVCIV